MLRPVNAGQAAPAGPQGTSAAQATPTGQRLAGTEETRAEIARILATSVAGGSMTSENRTYLTQLVAQRTGIPQQEAERRVNNAVNAARDAADKARHELAARVLRGLEAEVRHNLATLEPFIEIQTKWLDAMAKLGTATDRQTDFPVCPTSSTACASVAPTRGRDPRRLRVPPARLRT